MNDTNANVHGSQNASPAATPASGIQPRLIDTVNITVTCRDEKGRDLYAFEFPYESREDYLKFRAEWRATYAELSRLTRESRQLTSRIRGRWEKGNWIQEDFNVTTRQWETLSAEKKAKIAEHQVAFKTFWEINKKFYRYPSATLLMAMRMASKRHAQECWLRSRV